MNERGTPVGVWRQGLGFGVKGVVAGADTASADRHPPTDIRQPTSENQDADPGIETERRQTIEGAKGADRYCSQFQNYFTETCSGSEAGSYLRLKGFVYHTTLGSRVMKKNKKRASREITAP